MTATFAYGRPAAQILTRLDFTSAAQVPQPLGQFAPVCPVFSNLHAHAAPPYLDAPILANHGKKA
jgi:hypothetical protein